MLAGYQLVPRGSETGEVAVASEHSSFSGLGEFLSRWEMNALLFSIVYENVKPRDADIAAHEPWYSALPTTARERLNATLGRMVGAAGLNLPPPRLAFLFTQALAGAAVLILTCWLTLRRWPDNSREGLLRRAFLCLAWLWFLSATQNP